MEKLTKLSQSLSSSRFARDFYQQDALAVAQGLLGARLCTLVGDAFSAGVIVETEAYLGVIDKAAHAFGGRRTARTEVQYGPGGHAYISLVYGLHWQFNVVCAPVGEPHAVLIRALAPTDGIDFMRQRRHRNGLRDLASGPGKLCAALAISGDFYGIDLCGETVWIEPPASPVEENQIAQTPRIGIDYAEEFVDKPWRFCVKESPFLSRKVA